MFIWPSVMQYICTCADHSSCTTAGCCRETTISTSEMSLGLQRSQLRYAASAKLAFAPGIAIAAWRCGEAMATSVGNILEIMASFMPPGDLPTMNSFVFESAQTFEAQVTRGTHRDDKSIQSIRLLQEMVMPCSPCRSWCFLPKPA
jgi:hypothetical protein